MLSVTVNSRNGRRLINDSTPQGTPHAEDEGWYALNFVIGDSLARGLSLPRTHVMGLGGATTRTLLEAVKQYSPRAPPRTVTIIAGTNDLFTRTPETRSTIVEVANGLGSLICTLQNKFPNTKVGVVNLLPRGDVPGAGQRIEFANRVIQEHLTRTQQIYWISCYAPLINPDGQIRQRYYSNLKLHLNAQGKKILEESIQQFQTATSPQTTASQRRSRGRGRINRQ